MSQKLVQLIGELDQEVAKLLKTTFAGCCRNVNESPSRKGMQKTFGNIEHSDNVPTDSPMGW